MAVKVKNIDEVISQDRWEVIAGHDFNCRMLISPFNRRITIYEFDLTLERGAAEMLQVLSQKACAHGLDKIWLKTCPEWRHAFQNTGMQMEASIPGYYQGEETALIFALYLSEQRQTPSCGRNGITANKLVSGLQEGTVKNSLPDGITLQWGQVEHCPVLARLYSKVFPTYPFPVFDPGYLKQTMDNDTYYIMAWNNDSLIAAASAETNRTQKNAELTDFATLPKWRGYGLASSLLAQLEFRLDTEEFRCLYTIARSSSPGMNKVFASAGYSYRGVLINNCNIGGGLEDMNVWSKTLK